MNRPRRETYCNSIDSIRSYLLFQFLLLASRRHRRSPAADAVCTLFESQLRHLSLSSQYFSFLFFFFFFFTPTSYRIEIVLLPIFPMFVGGEEVNVYLLVRSPHPHLSTAEALWLRRNMIYRCGSL